MKTKQITQWILALLLLSVLLATAACGQGKETDDSSGEAVSPSHVTVTRHASPRRFG